MNYLKIGVTHSEILSDFKRRKSAYWMKKREETCLSLFNKAAKNVPAYKKFLLKNNINYRKIKNWEDYQRVPFTNKDNYLRKYPYNELYWGGNLRKALTYTSTSGSTGKPFYFAREHKLDWQNSIYVEQFVKQSLSYKTTPTLVIICFGMGIWIGGLINYKSFDMVANRCKLPLSVVTPGINSQEIMKILKNVSPNYKRIIIVGYPPFIKDLVDMAEQEGIDLKKKEIRLLFAAEAISEDYRDYMSRHLGIKDLHKDIMNIYGSAELGAMGAETLLSTLIKRSAHNDKAVFESLFGQIEKTPTFAQFIPHYVNFEQIDEKIVVTGDCALPLIRYDLGDNGGVYSFSEIREKLREAGVSLDSEIRKAKLDRFQYELPFVYVYERADLSTSFYGLWFYPEWIKPALYKEKISKHLTSRFTLLTKYDKEKNQYLEINLELRAGKKHPVSLEKIVLNEIVKSLTRCSSEYREMYNQLGKKAVPRLVFWPNKHELHFAPGIKQQWVKKDNEKTG